MQGLKSKFIKVIKVVIVFWAKILQRAAFLSLITKGNLAIKENLEKHHFLVIQIPKNGPDLSSHSPQIWVFFTCYSLIFQQRILIYGQNFTFLKESIFSGF